MKIKVKGKRQTIGVTQRQKVDNSPIRHLIFDVINDVIFDALNDIAIDIDVIMDKN
jgi:hypothetical protein